MCETVIVMHLNVIQMKIQDEEERKANKSISIINYVRYQVKEKHNSA